MEKIKRKIWTNGLVLSLIGIILPFTTKADWTEGMLNATESNLPSGSITGIITNIMQWILALIGVIAIIAFVIAGIIYLTSAGDEDRAQQAKRAMTYSIIGVIVALMGLVIIIAVNNMLTGADDSF